MKEYNPGFARYTIKAGTYKDQGIEGDVQTIQSPTVLMASSKTPADVIYKITKAIVEGRGEFASVSKVMAGVTAADMAQNFGIPYHPGAERYYKEIGVAK
jgi:TRAP transporter TAXI family solute receptor